MDKDTLKRVLRYVRQRKTNIRKEYEEHIGKGKTKAAQKIQGRIVTYNELIAYLEKLLKEIPEPVKMDNGELSNWPSSLGILDETKSDD